MEELLIFGDVAGQFDALMRLIDRAPKSKYLFVGDLPDRGPDSNKVIEWVMNNGESIQANHEDMMLDAYVEGGKYWDGVWERNGGIHTMKSYGAEHRVEFRVKFPKEHFQWLATRKMFYETDDLIVTHAPINARVTLEQSLIDDGQFEYGTHILWNRGFPKRREKFQIFGHNSHWGLSWFQFDGLGTEIRDKKPVAPEKAWAVCLDASKDNKLTAMHWPSKEIFQVDY